jgi:hypothetical protein
MQNPIRGGHCTAQLANPHLEGAKAQGWGVLLSSILAAAQQLLTY